MKRKLKKEITFTLTLDEKEAKMLRAMVQNPLIDGESEEQELLRKDIWDSLNIRDMEK